MKGGLNDGESMRCPKCLHEFGKEMEVPVGKSMPAASGGRSGARSSGVIRNLTAKKAGPIGSVGAEASPQVAAKSMQEAKAEMSGMTGSDEMIMPDGTRRVRRRKRRKKDEKNKGLILFLLGWFCVILIVFALFKVGEKEGEDGTVKASAPSAPTVDVDALMRRLLPEVTTQFSRFMSHPTIDGREQYIDRSAELSRAFNEFYTVNSFPEPESNLKRVDENVLSFSGDNIAIETIWESEKGLKWGAVHVFDKSDGWKLDWENFAPYSSEPWSRFRSNLGADEGEFRLLVRKRFSSGEDDHVYLNFYRAPKVFETGNEYKNTQSPEVEVVADSELGRQFLVLWEDYKEGKSPYGSILGQKLDPRNHLRVTVRLAWEKGVGEEEVMVLKEIIGVGWVGKRIQEFHKKVVREVTEEATGKLSESPVDGSKSESEKRP